MDISLLTAKKMTEINPNNTFEVECKDAVPTKKEGRDVGYFALLPYLQH